MKTSTTISLTDIVNAKYVLSNEDIARLATTGQQTQDSLISIRQAYLRVLLAGVQLELGSPTPRLQNVKKLSSTSNEVRTAQLKAIQKLHAQYYEVIAGAIVTPDIADHARLGDEERHRRALERNRRTNYARTAKSALKAVVSVGVSVLELSVMSVTKAQLRTLVMQRSAGAPQSTATGPRHLATLTERYVRDIRALAEADPGNAASAISNAIEQLGALALDLGTVPARKLAIGIKEHRPIRLKEGMFWPLTASLDVEVATPPVQ